MAKEIKSSDVKVVPFFARFLEEQASTNTNKSPWYETRKYPSDWEEY